MLSVINLLRVTVVIVLEISKAKVKNNDNNNPNLKLIIVIIANILIDIPTRIPTKPYKKVINGLF